MGQIYGSNVLKTLRSCFRRSKHLGEAPLHTTNQKNSNYLKKKSSKHTLNAYIIKRWKTLLLFGLSTPLLWYIYSANNLTDSHRVRSKKKVVRDTVPVSDSEADNILREREWTTFLRPDCNSTGLPGILANMFNYNSGGIPSIPVKECHVGQLESNKVIEDTYTCARADRGLLFGIFDGHSGTGTSLILKNYLPSYVISEINKISSADGKDRRKEIVSAMKKGFLNLDSDIVNCGFSPLMDKYMESASNTDIVSALGPSLNGSCALLVYIEGNDAYFANTGDSRAIIATSYDKEKFKSIQMTFDHTPENSREYSRILSEHPNEHSTVVSRGRILGMLQPSRAFGDSLFKYNVDVMRRLSSLGLQRTIKHYKTPPYVTAEPEVTYRSLDPSVDKFIFMGSDGIYDRLQNEEIVHLIAENFKKSEKIASNNGTITESDNDKIWLYKDRNPATHVIRNAVSGGNPEILNTLLALRAPVARSYRDDMTSMVLVLENEHEMPAPEIPISCKEKNSVSPESIRSPSSVFSPFDKKLVSPKPNRLSMWMKPKE